MTSSVVIIFGIASECYQSSGWKSPNTAPRITTDQSVPALKQVNEKITNPILATMAKNLNRSPKLFLFLLAL